MENGISIIIPTYNVPEYLYECVESIYNQKTGFNVEVIIGIDNCPDTLNHINDNKEFYNKTKIYYFDENIGPYIIKNNLINETSNKNILFFDSDDVMNDGMLNMIHPMFKDNDIVRFKFQNFKTENGEKVMGTIEYGVGVFGVRKEKFMGVNGFENWLCQADAEFKMRTEYLQFNTKQLEDICFKRRLHEKNLIKRDDTGMRSKIRKEYLRKTLEKPKGGKPQKLIKKYIRINEI